MGEVVLTDSLPREDISVDDEILIDLDYYKDERANAIIHEIEMEAKAEMEAEDDEEMMEEERAKEVSREEWYENLSQQGKARTL